MAITVKTDVILSNSVISSSLHGKNMRMNDRVVTDGGFQTINIAWTKTLREYEIGTTPLTSAQWRVLEGLHEITEGGAFGFLMEDPKDYKVFAGEGKISLISAGVYQLQKRYVTTGSALYKDRAITRPKNSALVISYDGVVMSSGYTITYTTGRVAFDVAPADPTLLSWTGMFYVPVHFTDDTIDWDLVVPGAMENRVLVGPAVTLSEIRE